MLSKAEQIKYCKKRWQNLEKYFTLFIASKNPEALHRLRVEIKKVDALVFLLQKCGGDKRLSKHLRPVKKIFKHAGIIRTAYLNVELIKKYNIAAPSSSKEESRIVSVEVKIFAEMQKNYLAAIKGSFGKFSKDLVDVKTKCITHFYKKQLRKIVGFFSKEPETGKLHLYRKKIKLLLYMHSLLNKSFIKKLQLKTSYLDELQDTIGKWHDDASAVELLIKKDHTDKKLIAKLRSQMKRLIGTIGSLTIDIEDKVLPKQL